MIYLLTVKGKISRKNCRNYKKDLSISCLLKESASILEQASRSNGGFKLDVLVVKLRPFCLIFVLHLFENPPRYTHDQTLKIMQYRDVKGTS